MRKIKLFIESSMAANIMFLIWLLSCFKSMMVFYDYAESGKIQPYLVMYVGVGVFFGSILIFQTICGLTKFTINRLVKN